MTETFTIGRASATSPFRTESLTESEDFALPVEPEFHPPGEYLLETNEESYATPVEVEVAGEQPGVRAPIQGQSAIAVQAVRQWDSVDRPAGWIGKVYGLVVHTTGGGLPASAKDRRIYHTVRAVDYYSQSHGCHYVNGWRGVAGGDLLQVANEREQANGVGVGDQRRSIDQGSFEKDLPAAVVAQWRARWPGVEHSLRLLPGTRTANACYVHVECVPCVFHHDGRLVADATPMRPGLRFTQAQHEAVALLACDIARRNGWPLQEQWWCTPKLLGHEDLTPYNRHDKAGGWDPGGMRAAPYFDWDFVYQMIERECRVQAAPTRPSWWPSSEAEGEDELFAVSANHNLSAESWERWDEQELEEQELSAEEQQHDEEEGGDEEEPKLPDDQLTYGEAGGDESGLVDAAEQEYEPAYQSEDEGESSLLEPFRVAMAVAHGQRDETALTNMVFFSRHPELGGRRIRRGETTLAREWLAIRNAVVRPVLGARAPTHPSRARVPASPGVARPCLRDVNSLTSLSGWERTLMSIVHDKKEEFFAPIVLAIGPIFVPPMGMAGIPEIVVRSALSQDNAITIGGTIWFPKPLDTSTRGDLVWLAHEVTHSVDFDTAGTAAFLASYAAKAATVRFEHDRIPDEIRAETFGDAVGRLLDRMPTLTTLLASCRDPGAIATELRTDRAAYRAAFKAALSEK